MVDMITESQALEIARKEVPDLDERQFLSVTDGPPRIFRAWLDSVPPKNVWSITYSMFKKDSNNFGLYSSLAIIICKETGEIIFNGCLCDEG